MFTMVDANVCPHCFGSNTGRNMLPIPELGCTAEPIFADVNHSESQHRCYDCGRDYRFYLHPRL